jgi:hypothetical protein
MTAWRYVGDGKRHRQIERLRSVLEWSGAMDGLGTTSPSGVW